MHVVQPSGQDIPFISIPEFSSATSNKYLLRIAYARVQKESPEFATLYENVDQNVDIRVSTLVFRVAPEPVLALYDFIMTTFVPRQEQVTQKWSEPRSEQESGVVQGNSDNKIRVLIKLEGIKGL
jgi:vacuolar protein sorting-associated protein 13A/C